MVKDLHRLNITKTRLSNFEILRIVAMFMVLIRHANFYALGMPSSGGNDFSQTQIFIMSCFEMFSDVGVNVFILISGYFGIKCTLESGLKFIFQCLFYSCGIFFVMYLSGYAKMDFLSLAECFYMRKINWFPKAYLCLFIFAPILNSFVENSNEKTLRNTLISFFLFQTLFGCISEATHFISLGYSTISFIGLYLLARYIRLYHLMMFKSSFIKNFALYLGCSLLLSILGYFCLKTGHEVAFYRLNAYCNPIVILNSVFLLLAFKELKFTSSFVNKIAASCFAVYLFHSNPNIIHNFYTRIIRKIYLSDTGGGNNLSFCFSCTGICDLHHIRSI